MKQLKINVAKFTANLVDGKPVLEKDEKTITKIVASTKSQNILVKDLQDEYEIVKVLEEKDLFLPFDFILDCEDIVEKYIKDEAIAKEVKEHIESVLYNLGCIVKKEK